VDDALAFLWLLLGAISCAAGMAWALGKPALSRAFLGVRGERRSAALERGLFRSIEPTLRWLGARIAELPIAALRARLEVLLIRSGSYLGLCADELLALCMLSAGATTLLALVALGALSALWLAVALGTGASLPLLVVLDHKRGRDRAITRRLPGALDLFALALNAGLDFATSLELVAGSLVEPNDPLREELRLLQQELAMGRARARALRSLADRTDVAAVRNLVRVLIQADRKGAPLATVLETQAEVARNQRSVLAEEAAARASIMLLGPLMLMLLAMLLLLLGPLAIRS
jgi:tight adherence protein C